MGTISDDIHIDGTLSARYFNPPAGSIGNASVPLNDPIAAEKVEHNHRPGFADALATTAAAFTRVIHRARFAGTTEAFHIGAITPITGNSTVNVDLRKNGTTVLTATVQLTSAIAAYTAVAGTVTVPALAAGDVLSIVVTVSAGSGTLPAGLFAYADIYENAATIV